MGDWSSAWLKYTDINTGFDIRHVMQRLLALDGVHEASFDILKNSVYIRFDADRVSMREIEDAVSDIGYEHEVIWEHA